MKKKVIISILIIIFVIMLYFFINRNTNVTETTVENTNYNKDDTEIIEKIKNETYATADTNMLQVEEEYDGRKILQIKPDIQFDTVLAGIIKNGKIKEAEITELLKNRPIKSGIWISKQSRESFLKILQENDIQNYRIDDEGYLYKQEGKDNEQLKNAISSDTLYIIDISGKCYIRDDLTGEIVEYPFEDMEPDQTMEVYSVENSVILEITTDSRKILSNKEILQDIFLNIQK